MALALASEEANHWTWEIATLGTDFQCVFWAHGGLSKSYHAFKSYFFKINLHMSIGISTTSLSLSIYIYISSFFVDRSEILTYQKKSNLLLISNYVYIYTQFCTPRNRDMYLIQLTKNTQPGMEFHLLWPLSWIFIFYHSTWVGKTHGFWSSRKWCPEKKTFLWRKEKTALV